ncbi:T6SS immunity protein Tdi1 domain-containing protein [Myceligenerans salitolerans]|uniref:DUF1851 domain-containing protein n=1 Tax=Myceligenerans salitolerans TaxID=1230528 RepID=A0ABS3IB25_9MICO|nr:T6SS immunity protein Tdi1 domain-containing protein [Myceligenerans salitolerans]MBO0610242.1 DUF1851 domain-containing protein [Myceligenerans salitolerans]
MHLIREFTPVAYDFALASWGWLGITDQVPRFASCFGDMFLESPTGWWFLDTVEGTLERRWRTMDEMFGELESADGRAEYLLEETLHQARARGLSLADDEVFAFVPPPAVTGSMAVENLTPLRFAIAASLSGRIHHELRVVTTPALPAAPTPPAQHSRPAAHAAPAAYTPRAWSEPTPRVPHELYTPRPYTPEVWSAPTPQAPAARNPAPRNPAPAYQAPPTSSAAGFSGAQPRNPAPSQRAATPRAVPDPLPSWAPPSHVPPETTLTGSHRTAPAARRARHFA